MSINYIGQTAQNSNPIDDFVSNVTRRVDANADGNLSSAEFSAFLKQFLGSAGSFADLATSSLAPETPTTPASPTTPATAPLAARTPIGTMAGFDTTKLGNLSHTTLKYEIGRILQFHPNTAEGLRAALPEIQQIVPGVRIAGEDKLDFGEYVHPEAGRIGVVDVIQSVKGPQGGVAWQWAPVE
jgi:hypothetical protein